MERTVKQVAGRVGLPERTVRYYDHVQLVSPRRRSSAGYRLYSPEDEGKLRFVRQAKSLGLSLEEIRALIAAAERGHCGEVVPELDRLLEAKVAEIDATVATLIEFRDRLKSFRTGHHSSCGCEGHTTFCDCLNGAGASKPALNEKGGVSMTIEKKIENRKLPLISGHKSSYDGRACGCDGSCGCGGPTAAAEIAHGDDVLEQVSADR